MIIAGGLTAELNPNAFPLPEGMVRIACDLYDPNFAPDASRGVNSRARRVEPAKIISYIAGRYQLDDGPGRRTQFIGTLASDAFTEGTITSESGLPTEELTHEEHTVALGAIESAKNLAEGLADKFVSQIPETVTGSRRMIAVAELVANEAYAGKERKSGRPFVEHPREIAAMSLEVFRQLEELGHDIDPLLIDSILGLDFVHDAVEETLITSEQYRPDHKASISPLVVRFAFSKTGGEKYAQDAALALRLLTHDTTTAWMPDYSSYIIRGSTNPLFTVVKLPDMKHNDEVEPKFTQEQINHPEPSKKEKIDEWIERSQLYTHGTSYLRRRLTEMPTADGATKNWGIDYARLLAKLPTDRSSIDTMVVELNQHVYGTDNSPLAV